MVAELVFSYLFSYYLFYSSFNGKTGIYWNEPLSVTVRCWIEEREAGKWKLVEDYDLLDVPKSEKGERPGAHLFRISQSQETVMKFKVNAPIPNMFKLCYELLDGDQSTSPIIEFFSVIKPDNE